MLKNKWLWIVIGAVIVAGVIFFAVRNNNKIDLNNEPVVSDSITGDDTDTSTTVDSMDTTETTDPTVDTISPDQPTVDTQTADNNSDNKTTTNSNSNTNKNSSSTTSKTLLGQHQLKDGTKFDVVTIQDDTAEDGVKQKWVTASFGKYVKEASIKEASIIIVDLINPKSIGVQEITTQFYITKDDVNNSMVFNNAIVYWGPTGVTEDADGNRIIPKNPTYDYFMQMATEPEPIPDTVSGLPFNKAKEVYQKYMSGQSKIEANGYSKYPDDSTARYDYTSKETSKLMESLGKEYKIDTLAFGDIIIAGIKYRW